MIFAFIMHPKVPNVNIFINTFLAMLYQQWITFYIQTYKLKWFYFNALI